MIFLVRGDKREFEFSLTQADGTTPFDLTNYTVHLSVKRRLRDTNYVIQKSEGSGITVETPRTNGKFIVTFDPADTINEKPGDLVYDVEIRDTNGNPRTVVEPSLFRLKQGVTE